MCPPGTRQAQRSPFAAWLLLWEPRWALCWLLQPALLLVLIVMLMLMPTRMLCQ